MQEEIFKDIPGYEGLYQVSNIGNVKSLSRSWVTGKGNLVTTKIKLLLKCIDDGYYSVSLCKDNNKKKYKVHQLVAMAFLNHTPCGFDLVIDHINDIKTDNRLENLHIVTQRYNSHKTQDKYSSQYKGVCWHKKNNKWQSRITINDKRKHLGYYDCELKAHLAYQNELNKITN